MVITNYRLRSVVPRSLILTHHHINYPIPLVLSSRLQVLFGGGQFGVQLAQFGHHSGLDLLRHMFHCCWFQLCDIRYEMCI